MSTDPFAGILDPFAWWDIAATYDKYAGFFDLVVYCSIFIALSHAVFTSRFSGRAGKALSTTVGIALGISLAAAEQQFGWNLRMASPIAVMLLLLLVGLLLLHTLLRVHVPWKLAVPLTYVILYLFVRAMSPALLDAITTKAPFINLLSAIIFLIMVWQLGVALWPRGSGHHHTKGTDSAFIAGLDRKQEKRQVKVEKRIKGKLTPQIQRETAQLERSLSSLLKELKKDKPRWKATEQALSDIAHRSDGVLQVIDNVKTLDRQLRNFDWHELQELNGYYRELSASEQERLKEQIQLERRKVVQEHAIMELAERCERRNHQFRGMLDEASRACSFEDRQGALQHTASALGIEEQQADEIKRLRQAEKRLLNLTKLKLRNDKS